VKRLFTAVMRMAILGVLIAFAGSSVAQQAYPSRPIRIIVPYPAGGPAGALARLVGQKMSESWGQPVLVDHRPGGNTVIGSEAMIKSAPDGHTLMVVNTAHIINAHLLPNLPYDSIRDFAPVGTLGSTELVMALNPAVPANTLQEFIALAKSRPGELNFASAGTGGVFHLAGELFNTMAGVKIQHVSYKGTAPGLTDLIGGHVHMSFIVPLSVAPHIKGGRLKGVAISGAARLPALPQVPTFAEAGLPGFDARFWFGVLAPAATPKEIVDKLSAEIARVLLLPDVRENLVSQGMEPFISSPEQFAALMKADLAKFAGIIKAANIKQLD
jgi:tripartite-type tricarboxylate transporter receptor subunit TctC